LTKGFEGALEFVRHDYDTLKITPVGDYVFVEGTSRGKLSGKTWTGGETPGGRREYWNPIAFTAAMAGTHFDNAAK